MVGTIPLDKVAAVKAAKPNAVINVYKNSGHGFVCDERLSFNKEATNLARARTMAFPDMNLSQ